MTERGRPLLTLKDLPKDWEKSIIELSKKGASIVELAVELFFNEIISGLTSGSRIELRGFGSFAVKSRNPRIARNPRTGEKVQIGSRLLPFFKAGKELNNLINS